MVYSVVSTSDKEKMTEEDLEQIQQEYEDGLPTQTIIDKHNLDVAPCKLVTILPGHLSNEICPYCDVNMYSKVRPRTYLRWKTTEKICRNCGHVINEYTNCQCVNCTKIETEKQKERQRIYIEKKQLIEKTYNNPKCAKKYFCDLTVKEKAAYFAIMSDVDRMQYDPTKSSILDRETTIQALNTLIEAHLISVSPDSDVSAFFTDDFPLFFNVLQVKYDVHILGNDAVAKKTNDPVKKEEDKTIIKTYLKEYMYRDALEYLFERARKRKIDIILNKNAEKKMHDLVEKIPYTEILYLIENQVKYYADQVNQGNIYRGLAGRQILGSVSANYDRLVARGWTPYKASPALAGDKLRSFIRCIMSEDIDILNQEIDKMDFFK